MHTHTAGNGSGKREVGVPSDELGFVQSRHWLISPAAMAM
jgi:hypothetical protein